MSRRAWQRFARGTTCAFLLGLSGPSLGPLSGEAMAAVLSSAQQQWYAARLAESSAGRGTDPAAFLAAPSRDPVADAIVQWDRLRRGSYQPTFLELSGFLRQHPGWPEETALRRKAEAALTPLVPLAERLQYFAALPPETAAGHLRYAEALLASGRVADAMLQAREAWIATDLSPGLETELLAKFGQGLSPVDHLARADLLLWKGDVGGASRLVALLPPDRIPLIAARIALQTRAPDAAARLAKARAGAATASLDDPGLIVDRANWLRQTGDSLGARRLMATAAIQPGSPSDAVAWMKARLGFARDCQRDRQYELAYQIAANHRAFPLGRLLADRSFAERDAYTDLEWLAGRVALEQLRRPDLAGRHFLNYEAASRTPISQTRGAFWAARAADAAGRRDEARAAYERAASHPDFFYGQLALERLGRPVTLPAAVPVPLSAADRHRFEQNELVRAVRILGELGDEIRQATVMRGLVERSGRTERRLLADLAVELGRPDLGVVAAKAARTEGERSLLAAAFPKLPLGQSYDHAWTMIHAITRQESQFDRRAVSPANARGLMQLMPGTASATARKLGLPYDYDQLTRDPAYNVRLGSTYFQALLDSWGGSHVLAVASYNAGPANVRRWIAENGDPRQPGVDVIAWIENIPFRETRGYVQRVLENAVVYDVLHPRTARTPATNRLSAYLGRREGA